MQDAEAKMIYEALRFASWAAGEGLAPIDGEDAQAPEDFLYVYSCKTGDEDWDTLPQRMAEKYERKR